MTELEAEDVWRINASARVAGKSPIRAAAEVLWTCEEQNFTARRISQMTIALKIPLQTWIRHQLAVSAAKRSFQIMERALKQQEERRQRHRELLLWGLFAYAILICCWRLLLAQ